jgi:flagellin-like protein
MSKGITPVVATVLLIAVTFAAAGTVYTLVEENTNRAEENIRDADLGLNVDTLVVENCYNQYGNTHIVMRNSAPDSSINASQITPLLNGTVQENFDTTPEIVEPQRSFTVNLSTQFGDETQVILTDGDTQIRHTCYSL